jgi:hypothetical protein
MSSQSLIFLGSVEQLSSIIAAQGGMDSVIQPYDEQTGDKITYRDCFTGHDISMQMDWLAGPDPQKRAACARPYSAALEQWSMYPKDIPWTSYVAASNRSSREVSP